MADLTAVLSTTADDAEAPKDDRDYYYRAGMPLRSIPPGQVNASSLWTPGRQRYVAPWIPCWQERPRPTHIAALGADHMWQGDEQMDAVVDAFRRLPPGRGRQLFETALDTGIDSVPNPPTELAELFRQLDTPPPWHDPEVWERGRQVWVDVSFAGKLGMVAQDFLATYAGADVSSAVGATGRFVSNYMQRTLETYTWFWSVTCDDTATRFSESFKNMVRLRLMHAQARAGLRRSWGTGHFAKYGCPISSTTVMLGAVSFGIFPLLIDQAHGRKITPGDAEAAMWYWNHIAYILGVPESIIPRTMSEALHFADAMTATQGGPTTWTEIMANAGSSALSDISGIRGAVARSGVGPTLGMIAYYGGEPFVRALLASTPIDDIRLNVWIALTKVLVYANVGYKRAADLLPGAAKRRRVRADDPFWRLQIRLVKPFAARKGIARATFTHHDQTPDTRPGCPIH